MFEEVNSKTNSAKEAFCDNVRDTVGKSVEEELFNVVLQNINSAERHSEEADIRENLVKTMLAEARLII